MRYLKLIWLRRIIVSGFFLILLPSIVVSQRNKTSFLEANFNLSRPLGVFSHNINSEGVFAPEIVFVSSVPNRKNLFWEIQYNYNHYDEAWFKDLNIFNNEIATRQYFETDAYYHGIYAGLRYKWSTMSGKVNPYVQGLIGIKWFIGSTKKEDAFYTWDTDLDNDIDAKDGEVIPSDLGVDNPPPLPTSSFNVDLSAISPSIGLGIGTHIKVYKSILLNFRTTFVPGLKTNYFNNGYENIYRSSRDNFLIISSTTPIVQFAAGFAYQFNKN